MAVELSIMEEHKPGICDSETDESLVAEKVVDVTEDCPGASEKDRCILLFTRAKRGRIVQIQRPYEGAQYMGSGIHFFVDELEDEMHVAPHDDTFGSEAQRLGLSKEQLRQLIEAQAPV